VWNPQLVFNASVIAVDISVASAISCHVSFHAMKSPCFLIYSVSVPHTSYICHLPRTLRTNNRKPSPLYNANMYYISDIRRIDTMHEMRRLGAVGAGLGFLWDVA
jgi:hypothetical protein